MVQFHQHIISDLLEEPSGGVVVLSAGLGLPKLVSTLLTLHDASQGSVLILNASPSQKASIDADSHLPSITADLSLPHRLSIYTSGGIFFITARILIVDLLTRRFPTTALAGILLLNAHSLSDTSTEAFIVRILRSLNRSLYVRAFSDCPQAMVSGFAKAERILKCLHLRKLHLWPRFQVYVSQHLERDPPEVIDIRVPMSTYMIGIQKAVIEVMDACLKEMRNTNKVDVEDLTVENGLFKSFDEIVRRQLEPIWHTLGKRTKQLVSDLKSLRKLLDYLARYDAVTYLKYLDSLRASESFRSVWIFAESSYKIFEYAKKRVYHFGRSGSGKPIGLGKVGSTKKRKLDERNKDEDAATTGLVLEEILEEPPKWKVLQDILLEIQEERQKQEISGQESVVGNEDDENGNILVACKDEHSCIQLQDCITKGRHKVIREEWEKYLLSKVELQALPKFKKKKPKAPKGIGLLDGVVPSVSGQKADPSIIILYHPDIAFVREIEVYKSENPSKRLKVYFLFYENSTEVQKFEASIRRENGAFESLIRQKSLMMVSVSQDDQFLGINSSLEPQSVTAQNMITRKAGGKKGVEKEMQIIVDMREFMSSLPNVLHQKGMRIVPVTLEVGDYILSPLICVERKSIQDLFMSFSSGRLYNQVEMMSRYYRIPVLLIEFSQDKSFSFQSANEISDDVTPTSIISKLSLLVLHFPRLRIVWSRSLHATAEIFSTLKANQDEPDEAKAIRIGVPSEDGIIEDDIRAENFNTSAVEFLRRLPGVTDSNYRLIMDKCKSLAEVALLPMEELAVLTGGHKAAKTLRDFLDAKFPTLL
ncbi:DNA repair endonuclease UVH1-like isoform X2 [Salvia splendens]|uniref:DNA repair endonuclease UVH1-like isoform X2 n=1 Tax=Salvia splendens TaxID=180675 RepID=UPI001C2517F7|nr:DNA repair endonuclease UVH1-like isoform X2 [Salvia splendens]